MSEQLTRSVCTVNNATTYANDYARHNHRIETPTSGIQIVCAQSHMLTTNNNNILLLEQLKSSTTQPVQYNNRSMDEYICRLSAFSTM